MLHCAGMDLQDIFDTLPDNGNANDYDKAIEALDTYFNPAVNVPYERHMFRQEESETIDQFVKRLKQKALSCDYGESSDEFIRDQVIDKCRSVALRRKLLERGQSLTFKQLQEISRAHEASYFQANKINDAGHEVKKENITGSFKVNLNHLTRNVSDVAKQITLPSHQSVQQNLLNVISVIRRDILQVCVELKSVMRETIKRK